MSEAILARLIIEAGAKGFQDVDQEIQATRASLNALEAGYQAGSVTLKQYLAEGTRLKAQLDQLNAGYKSATAAVNQFGSAQAAAAAMSKQAGDATKAMGMQGAMGLMALASAVDDAQYGFRAIVNNVPMVAQGLGSLIGMSAEASMKMGAIGGIAAVGINLLLPMIQRAAKEYGLLGSEADKAIGELERLKIKIKEIEDQPVKLVVDLVAIDEMKKRLKELEKGLKAYEEGINQKTPDQKKASERMNDILDSSGKRKDVFESIRRSILKELETTDSKLQENQKAIAEQQAIYDDPERYRKRQLAGNTHTEFERLLGSMSEGLTEVKTDPGVMKEGARLKIEKLVEARNRILHGHQELATAEAGNIIGKGTAGDDPDAHNALVKRLYKAGQPWVAQLFGKVTPDSMRQESLDKKAETRREKAREEQDKKSNEHAKAMENSVGLQLLKNPGMEPKVLEGKVKASLTAAKVNPDTINATFESVALKLRKLTDASIRERAISRNITPREAAGQLAREREAKLTSRERAADGWRNRRFGPTSGGKDFVEDKLRARTKMIERFGIRNVLGMENRQQTQAISKELYSATGPPKGPKRWAEARRRRRVTQGNILAREKDDDFRLHNVASGLDVRELQNKIADAVAKGDTSQAETLKSQLPEVESRRDAAAKAINERRGAQREITDKKYEPAFHGLTDFSRTLQTNSLKQDDAKRTAVATEKSASILQNIEAQMRAQRPSSDPDVDISE